MTADFTGLVTGDTVEVLVKGRVAGIGVAGGLYIGAQAGGTYIETTDAEGWSKIVIPWQDGDAVRVTSLNDQFVRNDAGFWFNSAQQQLADSDVDKYQSLGELDVLYAPGRQ